VTTDQDQAAELFKEIQTLIADDFWNIPLYNNFQTKAWSEEFTGFEDHRPLAWYVSYAVISPQ
jgi:ABC-type transport system substrate-binding protein